jgi:hypothetical protein
MPSGAEALPPVDSLPAIPIGSLWPAAAFNELLFFFLFSETAHLKPSCHPERGFACLWQARAKDLNHRVLPLPSLNLGFSANFCASRRQLFVLPLPRTEDCKLLTLNRKAGTFPPWI